MGLDSSLVKVRGQDSEHYQCAFGEPCRRRCWDVEVSERPSLCCNVSGVGHAWDAPNRLSYKRSYYEWQTRGKNKLPHFTKHKSHKIMLLAGLWDAVTLEGEPWNLKLIDSGSSCSVGETEPTYSFTIVTTDACKSFEWLHDRQPVILHTQTDLDDWLNPSPRWSKHLEKITQPYTGPELEW